MTDKNDEKSKTSHEVATRFELQENFAELLKTAINTSKSRNSTMYNQLKTYAEASA